MTFELDCLRTWVDVVDAGGFAKAVSRRHLSQPRVSVRVAKLERDLGCQLIDRRARPLTLTAEGARFLPRAREILDLVDNSVAEIRPAGDDVTGRLTVASFASASAEFLPGVLSQLREVHPSLDVSVIDSDVAGIDAPLLERRAQVALRPLRPELTDRSLRFRRLWREPFVVLAPTEHPILTRERITLEDVLEHPLITLGDPFGDPQLGYEAWGALRSRDAQPK